MNKPKSRQEQAEEYANPEHDNLLDTECVYDAGDLYLNKKYAFLAGYKAGSQPTVSQEDYDKLREAFEELLAAYLDRIYDGPNSKEKWFIKAGLTPKDKEG